MIRTIPLTLAILAATGALASCGGDDRPRPKRTPPPSTPAEKPAPAPKPGSTGEDRALPQIQAFLDKSKPDKANAEWRKMLPKPEEAVFSRDRSYHWTLETSKGTMKIRLRTDTAPMHATSTIYLTLAGFYDGLTIHRVNPGSTLQGGCPAGDGTGMPGYLINDEIRKGQDHDRVGLVSAANRGPSTDGSQFLITLGVPSAENRARFNAQHTIFGEVVAGADTLKAIDACGSPGGKPTERIGILKATVAVE